MATYCSLLYESICTVFLELSFIQSHPTVSTCSEPLYRLESLGWFMDVVSHWSKQTVLETIHVSKCALHDSLSCAYRPAYWNFFLNTRREKIGTAYENGGYSHLRWTAFLKNCFWNREKTFELCGMNEQKKKNICPFFFYPKLWYTLNRWKAIFNFLAEVADRKL